MASQTSEPSDWKSLVGELPSPDLPELLELTAHRFAMEVVELRRQGKAVPEEVEVASDVLRVLVVARGTTLAAPGPGAYEVKNTKDSCGQSTIAGGAFHVRERFHSAAKDWLQRLGRDDLGPSISSKAKGEAALVDVVRRVLARPKYSVLKGKSKFPTGTPARTALVGAAAAIVDLLVSTLESDIPLTGKIAPSLPSGFGSKRNVAVKVVTKILEEQGLSADPEKIIRAVVRALGGKSKNIVR